MHLRNIETGDNIFVNDQKGRVMIATGKWVLVTTPIYPVSIVTEKTNKKSKTKKK